MKINTKKSHKPLIIALVASVVIVIGALAFFLLTQAKKSESTHTRGVNVVDYGAPTKDQIAAGNSVKNSTDPNNVGSDRPLPPTPQTNGKSIVEVTIVSPGDQRNTNTVQIRASIGLITSSGTCSLVLTQGSTVIKKQASVQPLPSSSTCKGFDIPVSDLSSGQWDVSLTYENDTVTGKAAQVLLVR